MNRRLLGLLGTCALVAVSQPVVSQTPPAGTSESPKPPAQGMPPLPEGMPALPEGMPPPPEGMTGPPPKMQGPPPLPKNPDLPVFGPGGGRVLFGVAAETGVIRNLYPPLPADAPKPSAEPRNLEGAWAHDQPAIARVEWDMYGNEVPFTPTGRKIRDRRVKSTYVDGKPYSNASGECRPPAQPWLFGLYYPFQIYQSEKEILILFAMDHAAWSIRMDTDKHDPSAAPAYMGNSIGRWEGDTLVVDTVGYKDRFWMDFDGTPASKDARFVYRIRKIDYGMPKLEIVTTVHDPKMYSAPWSFVRTFAWRPDKNVLEEYNCESQTADGGGSAFGLVAEPGDE